MKRRLSNVADFVLPAVAAAAVFALISGVGLIIALAGGVPWDTSDPTSLCAIAASTCAGMFGWGDRR
jgi:hypothetical protein